MISAQVKEYNLYYTKREVSNFCFSIFKKELKGYLNDPLYLETSAGNGSFLDCIDGNKIGYDIFPQREDILKLDFLKENIKLNHPKKEVVIIGNPPFGKRSRLAINFFNKSAEYANTIAFIVPNQFKKYSAQSKLNKRFKLIYEFSLEDNSFLVNNKEYNVRCIFQIWTTLNTNHKDFRIKTPPKTAHDDFEIYQYNNTPQAQKYFDKKKYKWNFAVPRQGFYDYSKRIENPKELNTKIQWAFFKAKNKDILDKLLIMDFEKIAKNNTSILGFGKHDVIKEYERLYG